MPWGQLGLSWTEAGLTAITATTIYLAIILLTRLLGQRQFATSSTYDLAFIFALGSLIGRVILVRVSLGTALVGLVVMFALHGAVGWMHHRIDVVHDVIQNPPILLLAHGEVIDGNVKRARTSRYEIHEALRLRGLGSARDAAAVILERNGEFTVIEETRELAPEVFEEVVGREHLVRA